MTSRENMRVTLPQSSYPLNDNLAASTEIVLLDYGQHTKGFDPAQPLPKFKCPVVTLADALLQPWHTDCHIQALDARPGLPFRITKAAIQAVGPFTKRFCILDFDPPKAILVAGQAPEAWHTEMQAKLFALKTIYPGVLCYRTWKGYQVCWLLETPMEVTADTYASVHRYNHAVGQFVARVFGLEYDRAATSPVHIYRVPRAFRATDKDYRNFTPLFDSVIGPADIVPSAEDEAAAIAYMESTRVIGFSPAKRGGTPSITTRGNQGASVSDLNELLPQFSPIDPSSGEEDPERVARLYGLALLAATRRLTSAEGNFISPFSGEHSTNTDGTSSTRLLGSTFHSAHEHSSDSKAIEQAVQVEYLRGGTQCDSVVEVNNYKELTPDFLQPRVGGGVTVYLLTGPTGSGKTEAVVRLLRDRPRVVVQGHVALAAELARHFDVDLYSSTPVFNPQCGMSSTTDSLYKYNATIFGGQITPGTGVFVDEAGSSIRSIFGGTQTKTKTNYLNWRALQGLCTAAGVVVMADATFTALDAAMLRALLPGCHLVDVRLVANAPRYDGFTVTPARDALACDKRIFELLGAGSRVGVTTTSADYASFITAVARRRGYRVGVRMGGQSLEEELTPAQAEQYDLLVLSPAAAKGVSFTCPVDAVVGYFPFDPNATVRGLGAPTVVQLLGRFRNVTSRRIFMHCSNRQVAVESLQAISAGIAALDMLSTPESSLQMLNNHAWDRDFRDAYAMSRQAEMIEGHQVFNMVVAYLLSEGAVLVEDDMPPTPKSERRERAEEAAEIKAEEATAIAAAPVVTSTSNEKPATRTDRLAKTRAEACKALGQDVTVSDVIEYLDDAAKEGAALAAATLVVTHAEVVAHRDSVATSALKHHDLPRARAVRAVLRDCGFEMALCPTAMPPVVSALRVKAGSANHHSEHADALRALQLPVGRCGSEMLSRNLSRLGFKLRRNTREGTYSITQESWERAWRWAHPAAERMLNRAGSTTLSLRRSCSLAETCTPVDPFQLL